MAYTISTAWKSVYGNTRVICQSVTADSASGTIATGLGYIFSSELSPISMATASPLVKVNLNGTNSTTVGSVNLNGVASGDVFYLVSTGRS